MITTEDVPSLVGSMAQLVIAIGGLWAVVRLIVSLQFRVIQTTTDRNKVLEDRIEDLEHKNAETINRLDQEQENHRTCRQELHEHKLESAAQMAALQAQVDMLTQQINRPHRTTDPDE